MAVCILAENALILVDVRCFTRTLTTRRPRLRLRCATLHRCLTPSVTADYARLQDSSLLSDPNGWTSKPAALNTITSLLAGTIKAPTSGIKNILELKDLDQYVFSYKKSSSTPEVFYLFSSGSAETYQVESPNTQKGLWDVLKYNDWRQRLKLKDL